MRLTREFGVKAEMASAAARAATPVIRCPGGCGMNQRQPMLALRNAVLERRDFRRRHGDKHAVGIGATASVAVGRDGAPTSGRRRLRAIGLLAAAQRELMPPFFLGGSFASSAAALSPEAGLDEPLATPFVPEATAVICASGFAVKVISFA